jgi:hypothetical protein
MNGHEQQQQPPINQPIQTLSPAQLSQVTLENVGLNGIGDGRHSAEQAKCGDIGDVCCHQSDDDDPTMTMG